MKPRLTMLLIAFVLALAPASRAPAQSYPIFAGDPTDPATGRAYPILPGVPLVLPQPNGKYKPPIVVPGTIGDVDIVVRAGNVSVASGIPAPVDPPYEIVAGGKHVTDGDEIAFTVIASDGSSSPAGNPLLGPQMDGIPVVVVAFADLDGDGVVGPTALDAAGTADDDRELQEALYPVGMQIALFDGGVARGSIALWSGAPASAGGLTVVLTALAYVGPYTSLLDGAIPDGPPVATLLPFFPRLDPDRVIDGHGNGGPGIPGERFGVFLEPEFANGAAPSIAEAFALPTDGSSPTIDRVVVKSGAVSRARFVRPSDTAGFPLDVPVPLHVGAGGALLEPLTSTTVVDDGPGGATTLRLVPVDVLDDVTDAPSGTTVTLVAGPGTVITSPNGDADPSRETVGLTGAGGITVVLDDAGGANDSGTASTLAVVQNGFPTEVLDVQLTAGSGGGGTAPAIVSARLANQPANLVASCPVRPRLVVTVTDPQADDDSVTLAYTVDGASAGGGALSLSQTPPADLPGGRVYRGRFGVPATAGTTAGVTIVAHDAAGHDSTPVVLSLPVVESSVPSVTDLALSPATATAQVRSNVLVSARVADDCGVQRVIAQVDEGLGWRRVAALRDDGRHGDALAGDGVYSGRIKRSFAAGALPVRVTARNRLQLSTSSGAQTLTVGP
ncbi:hypothetical protein K2Z84_11055 [Candidatus Binatia bacterium]|nr:hypothetical protein [Candidatus Binatia bacterium]